MKKKNQKIKHSFLLHNINSTSEEIPKRDLMRGKRKKKSNHQASHVDKVLRQTLAATGHFQDYLEAEKWLILIVRV